MDKQNWNDRYAQTTYAYGKNPNDFLLSVFRDLPPGPVLCIGEGEGRNAVFLAEQGYDVTAVDFSAQGLLKATQFAREKGVSIQTVEADLSKYDPGILKWKSIISVFCHLPSYIRQNLYTRCIPALQSGGAFVLEAYSPNQLLFDSGGPKSADFLASLTDLKADLSGIDFKIAHEIEREVWEGDFHRGLSAVVQIFGLRNENTKV